MNIRFYAEHVINTLMFYQRPFSQEWDEKLIVIMAEGEVVGSGEYTITFLHKGKRKEVWVANKFFAYGNLYRVDGETVPGSLQCRPSAKTMLQLDKIASSAQQESIRNMQSDFIGRHQL
ncbi:hypothetical protein [Erwinia sp. E_sp_B04_7]|uniref:hypothetical protein n=1 Tax=unclassified Erwinia TaxID=2622719 RepID=UPI0030D2292D